MESKMNKSVVAVVALAAGITIGAAGSLALRNGDAASAEARAELLRQQAREAAARADLTEQQAKDARDKNKAGTDTSPSVCVTRSPPPSWCPH